MTSSLPSSSSVRIEKKQARHTFQTRLIYSQREEKKGERRREGREGKKGTEKEG